jgi:ABC-type branched-subunit amino acid transport system permease subunit
MKKIREVLLNEYIGAVAIGVILASAVSSLIGVVVQSVAFFWESKHRTSSIFESSQPFPWSTLLAGLVPVALYFLAAYVLLRWLYLRPEVPANVESEGDQPDALPKDDAKS